MKYYLSITFLAAMVIWGIWRCGNEIRRFTDAPRHPVIYIINLSENKNAVEDQIWMVHYSIDGFVQTAFFPTSTRANDYINWLQQLPRRQALQQQ